MTLKSSNEVSKSPLRVSMSSTSKFMRPQLGAVAARYLPERESRGPASCGFFQMSSTPSDWVNGVDDGIVDV